MKMSDVKVGMVLKSTYDYDVFGPITVTELTEKGFKYTHAPKTMKIGYSAPGIPEFGTTSGGEHYGSNGEINYEPIENNKDTIVEEILNRHGATFDGEFYHNVNLEAVKEIKNIHSK